MKRAMSLASFGVFLWCANSFSQEPAGSAPARVIENTRYLVGNWVADVELEGQKREVIMSVKAMPGEVGYIIHWKGPGGPGKPDTRLTGIGGWDAAEQVYRELGFGTNGDAFSFVYKQTSDSTFEGEGSGTYLGKKMREKVTVDRKNRNEYTWKASEITVGDKKLPDEVYYFRRADAQEPHKAWWKYLQGEWTYEITPLDSKGTVDWRIAAEGNAMVGKFADTDGLTSIELSGWRSDKKTMVANGYGSQGNWWQLDFTKVTAEAIEGPNYGVLPDGRTYKGLFSGKKIDDDHYEWNFVGKTGDGEELSMTGKYTRRSK